MTMKDKIATYKKARDIVKKVTNLFKTGHWTRGAYADLYGNYCLMGGIGKVAEKSGTVFGGAQALTKNPALTFALGEALGINKDHRDTDTVHNKVVRTNDDRGKAAVMDVLAKTDQHLKHCMAEYEKRVSKGTKKTKKRETAKA